MQTLKKYRITGIDCANCASDIERTLQKQPGMGEVRLNFATQTLGIAPEQLDTARRIIKKMEPQVRIDGEADLRSPANQTNPTKPSNRGGNPTVGPVGSDSSDESTTAPRFFRALSEDSQLIRLIIGGILFLTGILLGSVFEETGARGPASSVLVSLDLAAEEFSGVLFWLGTLTWIDLIFTGAFLVTGWPVVASALGKLVKGRVFDETLLMTIATLGAAAIGEFAESAGVMIFYGVGEWLQDRAVNRSRKSISALVDLRPDTLRLILADGGSETIPASQAEVGDRVEHWPGERVGVDGELISSRGSFDTSALTGESVPRSMKQGDDVSAGFLVADSPIQIRVTRRVEDSAVSRILRQVEDATDKKAKTERFIARFAQVYTPIVVGLALIAALVPPLFFGGDFNQWVYRALTLLVISCPCALVISIPLGYFAGLGAASRKGVLVKGAEYLDRLAALSAIAFDKTGTLTRGVFEVRNIRAAQDVSPQQVLAVAALVEQSSTHPIARAILGHARSQGVELKKTDQDQIIEYPGRGLSLEQEGREYAVGNATLMEQLGIPIPTLETTGTVVLVSRDGQYLGHIEIDDELKTGTAEHLASLKAQGVQRMMLLTGDRGEPAQRLGGQLGIEQIRHSLLPGDKVTALEEFMSTSGGVTGFVGDGINDAPVLARADVGIAMGGLGSDAAIEAADVVLMGDNLAGLGEGIRIGKATRRIIVQNIVFALGFKLVIMALGLMGEASMWQAVIADVGVALVAVLNSIRILRR